ncbi:MAG: hypothetical protein V4671_00920 [Armatimonadota bacterium]
MSILKTLKNAGLSSDLAYTASLASVGLSIAIWSIKKQEGRAEAERFGIFVGLWAPTLAIFANALQAEEKAAEELAAVAKVEKAVTA